MSLNEQVKSSFDTGSRSSIFTSSSLDKRNLWWKAFRKTVLEPHGIVVLENPMTDKIPQELLTLVENKCRNLERHEQQALVFVDAVAQGRGFGPSPIFPPDVVPPLPEGPLLRSLEPVFDQSTLPHQEDSLQMPLFDLPVPRPGLLTGFSKTSFTQEQFEEMPATLATLGTLSDYGTGRIQPGRAVYAPFLLFERTYGHTEHELAYATNYCAIDGAAALNSISMLYDTAWPERALRRARNPIVFSVIIDNDLGIINHHWMSGGGFFTAPLCRFDFRDLEHHMHFLAWVEAIEEWATTYLLPDIEKALQISVNLKLAGYAVGPGKALPSPFSDEEKKEMLSRSMKEPFDNIPWKGERFRKTPLGVTGTMRMRSPNITAEPEPVVTLMSLSHNVGSDTLKPSDEFQSFQKDISNTPCNTAATSDRLLVETTTSAFAPLPVPEPPEAIKDASKSPPLPPLPVSPPDNSTSRRNRIGLSLKRPSLGKLSASGPTSTSPTNPERRPITSAGPDSGKSTPAATTAQLSPPPLPPQLNNNNNTIPVPRPTSRKSPGIITQTIEMKSPSQQSTYSVSIQSKRSFTSLRSSRRKDKTPKDQLPTTPDSTLSTGSSPKGLTFKAKLSNSLGMIKEHARPRRQHPDNSAPSSAKDAIPLPTPAYDRKRFDIKTPKPVLPETPRSIPDTLRSMSSVMTEGSGGGSGSRARGGQQPPPTDIEAYHASHPLPLRQWANSPTSAVTTTTELTARG